MKILVWICQLAVTRFMQAQGRFTIEGTLSGVGEGTVLYLLKLEGERGVSVALDTVKAGKFFFEGKMPGNAVEPYFVLAENRDKFPSMSLDLWLEPGARVNVKGGNTLIHTWQVESNVALQETAQRFIHVSREEYNAQQRLSIAENSLRMLLYSVDGQVREQARMKLDSLRRDDDALQLCIAANNIRLMKELPIDEVWLNELRRLANSLRFGKDFPYRDEIKALYERLDEGQKCSDIGKIVYMALYPPIVVKEGDKAADADLYDLQGNIHRLSEWSGKYVLIDFWSRACVPCIKAHPLLKEVVGLYKGRLEVVSLNVDDKEGWEDFSEAHPMDWNNWSDLQGMNGIAARYGVEAIPYYVLIAPDGRIVKSWAGGDIKSKLSEFLR